MKKFLSEERWFVAFVLLIAIPEAVLFTYHPETHNWPVVLAIGSAYWAGLLSFPERVKETVRTVTRYIVTVIEVRR